MAVLDLERRELKSWCDSVGGEMTTPEKGIDRCVLNNQAFEQYDTREKEWDIDDTEYVEIDSSGIFRAVSRDGEAIEIVRTETVRDEGEQVDYDEEDVADAAIDNPETVVPFGDLTASSFAHETKGGESLIRKIHVKTQREDVSALITTQQEMDKQWQAKKATNWIEEAERAVESGAEELPHGRIPFSGKDPAEWIQTTGDRDFRERLESLQEQLEENREPENEPFPCPDDGEFVEAQFGGYEIEGEVDRIDCTERKTVVGVEGDDGSSYVFKGSPDGSTPKQIEVDGRRAPYHNFHVETYRTTSLRRSF